MSHIAIAIFLIHQYSYLNFSNFHTNLNFQ